MKEFLKIPCSEQRLVDGSIVILDRFPNTKWIVHNDWYTYQNVRYNGWHFSSIPSRTILPCSDRDLCHLVVISGGDCDCGCDCRPKPPHPHPHPPQPGPGPDPKPEPGPHPPRPEPPTDDCHNPQKYYGGVHYPAGALIYLEYGDIYQATCNFRSSWNGASVADNLKTDIQSGYLVKVPNTIADKLNERIDSAFHELDETNERISDVETIRFAFNFSEVFEGEIGEDGVLTRAMAEKYLDLLDPPIKPRIGIYFKNTDKNSPTTGHVFTYYTHPTDSSKLIFIDDIMDTHVKIDGKVDKTVAGEGGRIVKNFEISKSNRVDGIRVKKDMLSLENGSTEEVNDLSTYEELGIASKQSLDDLSKTVDTKANSDDVGAALDDKVDKTIAGEDSRVLTSATVSNNAGDGIVLETKNLSLEDGSKVDKSSRVTLNEMGAVSQETFNEYKTATATTTDARNQEVNEALDARVEKSKIGNEVIKSVEHSGIAAGGIVTKTTKVDPSTGTSTVETAELTAKQLGVATAKQVTDLQAQIDAVRGGLLRYEVDFDEVFGTAAPTKTDVDGYFTGLGVMPYVGTAIINNNSNQSTYKHVFTYYIDETVSPVVDPDTGEVTYKLKLVDDGPDNISTASEDTLGGVRGAGDISVDSDGNMHIKSGTVNKNELGEDVTAELADAVKKSESKSLCDGVEVTGTGDGIKAATNFTEYAGADSLPDKQKSKNWTVSLNDMGAFSKEDAKNKLDKVSGAIENHVAVFDADGNIKDAGEGIPDLEPKMDKVKTAIEGHIAVFDATGNVVDSGKTLGDMAPQWVDYDPADK